jgi:hypothetical protein
MAEARATWPDARLMADGRVRIPAANSQTVTVSGTQYQEWAPDTGWEVEPLPDPEPRWQPNDVITDASGEVFVRTEAGRWRHVLGLNLDPIRPLTRLVPAQ